jgi:hypothetical protein
MGGCFFNRPGGLRPVLLFPSTSEIIMFANAATMRQSTALLLAGSFMLLVRTWMGQTWAKIKAAFETAFSSDFAVWAYGTAAVGAVGMALTGIGAATIGGILVNIGVIGGVLTIGTFVLSATWKIASMTFAGVAKWFAMRKLAKAAQTAQAETVVETKVETPDLAPSGAEEQAAVAPVVEDDVARMRKEQTEAMRAHCAAHPRGPGYSETTGRKAV